MTIQNCKRTPKVESKLANLFKKVFILTAYAEENPEGASTEDTQSTETKVPEVNIEQLLASVRQEEKAKLYPEIKKLKEELAVMTKNNNENLIKCATLEAQIDSKGEPAEMGELRAKITELTKQVMTMEAEKGEAVDVDALRAEIEAEYTVKLYMTQKLGELKGVILPTFEELIQGDTIEEIDASIEKAKSKTKETKELLGIKEGSESEDEEAEEVVTPKKKKKPSATNPSTSTTDDKLFDEEYVKNLDPKSKEYAEWREKVGLSKY